jgi:hypothetical protein
MFANWLACQLNVTSICGVWVLKLVCLVGFIFLEGLKKIEQITMDSASIETNMVSLLYHLIDPRTFPLLTVIRVLYAHINSL